MENYTEYKELSPSMLKRWWKNKKNVLVYGDHGCGKTTIIKEFWDSLGIKHAIFSGSTLDPWTDLIGVPKPVEKNGEDVLKFVVPENIDTEIEAIFIDEFNRSHPKVRNALMELMQFKTINGRKFPKLKAVWAAANPPDTDQNYDVEPLDPAQEDRFHVRVKLCGEPHEPYFVEKYGVDIARAAIGWRKGLSSDQRQKVSPRRLDYALDYVVNEGGTFRETIPQKDINVSSLERSVKFDSSAQKLKAAIENEDEDVISLYFGSDKYEDMLPAIVNDYTLAKGLVGNVDCERLFSLCAAEPSLALLACDPAFGREDFNEAIESFRETNGSMPRWYDSARGYALKLRGLHRAVEESFEKFSPSSFNCPNLGELHKKLTTEKMENLIDELDIPEDKALIQMTESSAINFIKLARDHYSKYTIVEDHVVGKFETLLYSSLYTLYNKFGQLIYLGFLAKGFEIAIRPVVPIKSATSAKVSRPRAGRSRGGSKIQEEVL